MPSACAAAAQYLLAVQRQLMLRRSSRSEKPAREIAFDERGYRVHRDAFECEPSRAANTREAFD